MHSLDNIPKENNFKTPNNYINNLSQEIINKIEYEESKNKTSFFQYIKPYIYLIASMIILILAIKFGLNKLVKDKTIIKHKIEINENPKEK